MLGAPPTAMVLGMGLGRMMGAPPMALVLGWPQCKVVVVMAWAPSPAGALVFHHVPGGGCDGGLGAFLSRAFLLALCITLT